MASIWWVGVGGFIGSILRFVLTGLIQEWTRREDVPIGTLVVNLVGCLFVGVISQLAETRGAFSPETRALVVVGVLGGFTTFSAFGNETIMLWRNKESLLAFSNVATHVVVGLGMVCAGRWLAEKIWG